MNDNSQETNKDSSNKKGKEVKTDETLELEQKSLKESIVSENNENNAIGKILNIY